MPLRHTRWLVFFVFAISGIAGLGYQVTWTRMFAVGLGHEMPGLLAVVTAFFVGLGLGGLLLDGPISRSRRPGRWYAWLEVIIGVWAIVIAFAAPALARLAADLIGPVPTPARQWTVAFLLPMLSLLPATVAMGGTLPAIERLAGRLAGRGTLVAGLYAANTFGAMLGIVLAATVFMPMLGLRGTGLLMAGINLLAAALTWFGPAVGEAERPDVAHAFEDAPGPWRIGGLMVGTGFLGIAFEVAGVRIIGQVLENTVYTYASTVAMFLAGTAVGAAVFQRFGRVRRFGPTAGWLLLMIALGVFLGSVVMPGSAEIQATVRRSLVPSMPRVSSILAELTVAALVFGPATLAMGAMFSHAALAARGPGGGIGRAAGLNTLAGAAAPAAAGLLGIPLIGGRATMIAIAAAYVLLALATIPWPALRWRWLAAGIATAAAAAVLTPPLMLVEAPAEMRTIASREGVMGTVLVAEQTVAPGGRLLKVNNAFNMGGTRFSFGDRRQTHVPLMCHPAPREVLFLGVGSGLTAGAAVLHRPESVTAVELVPEVVEMLPEFSPQNRYEQVDRMLVADARRFVRTDDRDYDVIVADLFHPARDGAGTLYTLEHFAAVRDRLASDGIFCQWLPLYQLDADTVRMIVRTFREVFPNAEGWLATYNVETPMLGLIGGRSPDWAGAVRFDDSWIATVRARAVRGASDSQMAEAFAVELQELALTRLEDLAACRMLDVEGLAAFAGDGPLNTDDRPRVMFNAPWHTYATPEAVAGPARLSEVLAVAAEREIGPRLSADMDEERVAAVRLHRTAVERYLKGTIALKQGDGDGLTWLLESAGMSDAFSLPVAVIIQQAEGLIERGRTDAAVELMRRLREQRPSDPRILQEMQRLFRAR
ncbi:MAG: fused MFS/spermidine synthase [Phycisphaerales bacterium]